MNDEIEEGEDAEYGFEVDAPDSECYPCANGDLIFPDGVSAFCQKVGAILVRTISKSSDVQVLDIETFKWRDVHKLMDTGKVASIK